MQIDFSVQQAGSKKQSPRQRAAHAAVALLLASAVSLVSSFAMGLQDAGWAEAWTRVGHAYTLFSAQESRTLLTAEGAVRSRNLSGRVLRVG